MTDHSPALSVIITSVRALDRVPAWVGELMKQNRDRPVEIILAGSHSDESLKVMAADHPEVVFIPFPPMTPLPRLLGAAVSRSTGEIITITDMTCEIDRNWISEVMKAHENPSPVIGGAVEPKGLRGLVEWTAYFCDYGQFMLPLKEGIVNEVPGNNLSFKRGAIARGRKFLEGEFWKTYWCRQIQAEGFNLYSVPTIVVFYRRSFQLGGYLVHRFHNGRCFAGMRIPQLSRILRILYLIGSPLLPILICVRIFRAVIPKGRYLGRFFACVPIIIFAALGWALGEFVGYLSGTGTSCRYVR